MSIFDAVRKKGLLRGLRPLTIQLYAACLRRFFCTVHKLPHEVRKNDIEDYLYLIKKRGASGSTLNVYLNALKFFYGQILHRRLAVHLQFSKIPKRVPDFLEQDEVVRLFAAIKNPKHQLMVRFFYSAGLRVSEFLKLRVCDLALEQGYGWVRNGKGGKDRLFIIAENLKEEVGRWIKKNGLSEISFLFTNWHGQQYDASTMRAILKKAAKRAGIKRRVYPHLLRHSFATHLGQNGYAVTHIQPLLGHSRPETTMQYLHVAYPRLLDVKSPYDSLPYDSLFEHVAKWPPGVFDDSHNNAWDMHK